MNPLSRPEPEVTTTVDIPEDYVPDPYAAAILAALQGRHIYLGTANPKAVAKRRLRNRLARQSRKANR